MKGRKLILEEVLDLEDGTKVWVKDSRKGFDSVLCKYNKNRKYLIDIYDYEYKSHYCLNEIKCYEDRLTFYEWIEEETPLHKMAKEVVNLRGLDLTDDNIRLIVEEFS